MSHLVIRFFSTRFAFLGGRYRFVSEMFGVCGMFGGLWALGVTLNRKLDKEYKSIEERVEDMRTNMENVATKNEQIENDVAEIKKKMEKMEDHIAKTKSLPDSLFSLKLIGKALLCASSTRMELRNVKECIRMEGTYRSFNSVAYTRMYFTTTAQLHQRIRVNNKKMDG